MRVTLDVTGADLVADGVIGRVSAAAGEGQSGRLVFARLTEPFGFRPGDFVSVEVQEPALENVVRLPASALGANDSVLVLGSEDRLEEASVELVRRQDDDVLVRGDGLDGREVVRERSPLLGEGIAVRPMRPEATDASAVPRNLKLSDERRAQLVALVQANTSLPDDAKSRMLAQLAKPHVPAQVVARIESRMGG